jgi:hypothetical protein
MKGNPVPTSPTASVIAREIDEAMIVQATPGQVSADLGGATAILHIDSGYYYALNAVGARVWELVKEEPITVKEILRILLEEYDVAPERCARDLHALLHGLAERGLVEVANDSRE